VTTIESFQLKPNANKRAITFGMAQERSIECTQNKELGIEVPT
jgi:hypothetical protein